jgi:excinuclease UvrABC nuclease subunit
MKPNHERMIQEVIKTINWNRIKYFHQVFGIKWEFEEKEGYIVERFPTISELKDELRTILSFVIERNQKTLDYGNWLVFWTDEETAKQEGKPSAKLEAIFSLEDTCVVNADQNVSTVSIEVLENKLKEALLEEKYEKAASLRDQIASLKRKANNN